MARTRNLDERNSANADLLALLKAKTVELQPPTNLAPLMTRLIDRQEEVQHACTLLQPTEGERLLTLTGIRGIGKTRLALQVAEQLKGTFVDGVYLVELYAITDPNAVMASIAGTLGLEDFVDTPPLEQLKAHLQDRGRKKEEACMSSWCQVGDKMMPAWCQVASDLKKPSTSHH